MLRLRPFLSRTTIFRWTVNKMLPFLSRNSSSPSITVGGGPLITRALSASSVESLAEYIKGNPSKRPETGGEAMTEEGLRHAQIKLEARQYKTLSFSLQLLECIQALRVPSWPKNALAPGDIKIHKVSGSLTNAVFFVSSSSPQAPRTLLLRIYGPSSGSLISRPRELHILHILSSQYGIGPRVYGTFENGRIEEYFDSTTLTAADIRDQTISRWIGARMAELHSVDVEAIEGTSPSTRGEGNGWDIAVKRNVKSWLAPAKEVLALPAVSGSIRAELDLSVFQQDWDKYMRWVSKAEDIHSGSRRVFAHNDAQYGNLLRLQHQAGIVDKHRQIIVVDFEYASPNPAAYDIANHFHEWTADYHSSTPHILNFSRYPTETERFNFYTAYLGHTAMAGEYIVLEGEELELQLKDLDKQVCVWSPASHGMWAIWGLIQGREDIEANVADPEFDYIEYARCRMAAFYREIRALEL